MSEPEKQDEIRDEKGRFRPGCSGNPGGKPPGTISWKRRYEQHFSRHIDEYGEDLTRILFSIARSGDMRALALILERTLPKVDKHEFDAGAAPTRMLIEFAKNNEEEGDGGEGDAG